MLLNNVTIVLLDDVIERGALQIEGERIAAIHQHPVMESTAGRLVDGRGLTVIPGLIDMHGDMIEQELEPRPGVQLPLPVAIAELDKRLAGCGVTTAYAGVAFWEPQSPKYRQRSAAMARELTAVIHALRDALLTDMRVHARYEVSTPVVRPALRAALDSGAVQLLSLMDHTPGQGQYRDLQRHNAMLARRFDADGTTALAEYSDTAQLERWRSAADLVDLARNCGITVASHDDDTPAKVALMAEMGVTMSEFPVTLEAAAAAHSYGMTVAMGAPNALRGQSHSGNLSALEAIQAGCVDLLAADYAPTAMLHAVCAIADAGILSLPAAINLVSAGPAAALGLNDRGRIAVGLRADLAVIDLRRPVRVHATIRGGTPIYRDARIYAL
jgi:alpha-D-ribose 1-methylphosphonate 5-triphosphate diphosphatase